MPDTLFGTLSLVFIITGAEHNQWLLERKKVSKAIPRQQQCCQPRNSNTFFFIGPFSVGRKIFRH
jgi:hypothetical protein